jgi:hypothetical protein
MVSRTGDAHESDDLKQVNDLIIDFFHIILKTATKNKTIAQVLTKDFSFVFAKTLQESSQS